MHPTEDRDSQEVDEMSDFGDHVDDAIFGQILEMDESEEERDFSEPLVFNFFQQALETFERMKEALDNSDLEGLSSLGHFLKGSSATLGFNKIRDSCQVIQQYGHKLTVDGTDELDEKVCLEKIADALKKVKVDTETLNKKMEIFFKREKGDEKEE
ncbi:signal transduction histidine kinase [Corynascus novoguineensis]|uniref:Signal transduction histidine kinase n=1 Tax=Corynascus novoguineensis TaxID=1126955 RepID=A0AAN7HV77_9PEZI|nr:signal transduction histidine kinase [Corynascus novoguineensis]